MLAREGENIDYMPVIQVDVSDLEKSRRWYQEKLRFNLDIGYDSDVSCQLILPMPLRKRMRLKLNLNPAGVKPGDGVLMLRRSWYGEELDISDYNCSTEYDEWGAGYFDFFSDPDGNRLGFFAQHSRFDTIIQIPVSDLKRSVEWYEHNLGLDVYPGYLHRYKVLVHPLVPQSRYEYYMPSFIHWRSGLWLVQTYDATKNGVQPGNRAIIFDMTSRGIGRALGHLSSCDTEVGPLEREPGLLMNTWFFTDPDGNRLGLRLNDDTDFGYRWQV